MVDFTAELLDQTTGGLPATTEEIAETERVLGVRLPSDLTDFYRSRGCADGEIALVPDHPDASGWLILLRVTDLGAENARYDWRDPRLIIVGTDGEGEAYALDYRFDPPHWVVVPFLDLDLENALPAGRSLGEFVHAVASRSVWET